jgi:hypothetical protein
MLLRFFFWGSIVQSLVIKKLTNPRDCDAHNVCEANPVAEQIRAKVLLCVRVCVCVCV